MKIFRKIFYPVIAVLAVVLIITAFLTSGATNTTSVLSSTVRTKIDEDIAKLGASARSTSTAASAQSGSGAYIIRTRVDDADADGNTVFKWLSSDKESGIDADGNNSGAELKVSGGVYTPAIVYQFAVLKESTVRSIPELSNDTYYIGKHVNNVVAYVPGSVTLAKLADPDNTALSYGDVVMMTANYDSLPGSGGADNSAAVATMMEVARIAASQYTENKNDFLFVFTDAKEEGSLGAYAFKYQFKGFDDVYSRVKVGFNFESKGNEGVLMASAASNYSYLLPEGSDYLNSDVANNKKNGTNKSSGILSYINKLGAKGNSSSIYSSLYLADGYSDFNAYDVPAINFSTVKNGTYGTKIDTYENIDKNLVIQYGNVMKAVIDNFANADLNIISSGTAAGFFSYLGLGMKYPHILSYILGALIVLLLGFNIYLCVAKQKYSLGKIIAGIGVQLLTAVAAMASLYVVYFLAMLILSGFQVVDVHSIASLSFTNVGMIISFAVATCVAAVAFYILFKKLFRLNAPNVVRGNVLLLGLVAAIVCFAAPSVSYIFSIISILQLAIFTCSALLKDKFAEKFGYNIEQLFLYFVPVVIMLPVLVSDLFLVSTLSTLLMMPLYMMMFMLFAGSILPYADYLKGSISKLYAKLPKASYRERVTVTEKVEDPAKKGKFTEVEKVVVKKTKVERVYSHPIGITACSLIAAVMLILFSAFGHSAGAAMSSSYSMYDDFYKNSLVYVWESSSATLEIHDLDMYKYYSAELSDYSWDATKRAYVKSTSTSAISSSPSISQSEKTFTFNTRTDSKSRSYVKLSNFGDGGINTVTFRKANEDSSDDGIEFDYVNNDDETMLIYIPYDTESGFTLEIEGILSTVDIELVQIYTGVESTDISDWTLIKEAYSGADERGVSDILSLSMLIKLNGTYTIL